MVSMRESVELATRPLTSTQLYDPTFGNIDDLIYALFQAEAESGGATLHAGNHSKPTEGFIVAIHQGELRLRGMMNPDIVRAWLETVARPLLSLTTSHIGIWTDKATDETYLDVVQVVDSFESAMELAARNEQVAFWDAFENKEVRVSPR